MAADQISPSSQDNLRSRGVVGRVLWLLPLVFVIHDGEELLTMPGWIALRRHRTRNIHRIRSGPYLQRQGGGSRTPIGKPAHPLDHEVEDHDVGARIG